jgi:hypothetical protein
LAWTRLEKGNLRGASELPAAPGLTLTVYTGEPGSSSAEKLHLLGSWAASPNDAQVDSPIGRLTAKSATRPAGDPHCR